jgi:hypothetical protein
MLCVLPGWDRVGLTVVFGFGNAFDPALRPGAPPWVAPLVAAAVNLSILMYGAASVG